MLEAGIRTFGVTVIIWYHGLCDASWIKKQIERFGFHLTRKPIFGRLSNERRHNLGHFRVRFAVPVTIVIFVLRNSKHAVD